VKRQLVRNTYKFEMSNRQMMKWVGLVLLAVCFSVTSTFGIEKIVIGKDFENGGLYVPFQVEEGPDGNIYVFDAKDKAIKVYSPQV